MSGAAQRPAVLLLNPAPAPSTPLVERLGAERAVAVHELLRTRARAWAESVAQDAIGVAADGESRAEAVAHALSRHAGRPLLIAWPVLPRWSPEHATAALGDLAEGCGISFGPVFDGGFYLLALARELPDTLALSDGPDAVGQAIAAAHAAELEVGMLRAERGLRTAADVSAALADPLLDPELRALLG